MGWVFVSVCMRAGCPAVPISPSRAILLSSSLTVASGINMIATCSACQVRDVRSGKPSCGETPSAILRFVKNSKRLAGDT